MAAALPSELWRYIFNTLGRIEEWARYHYSEKERIGDLFRFCLISREVYEAARDELYGRAFMRNAGRAILFEETLAARADFANLVRSLSWPAENGLSNSVVLDQILGRLCDLLELELSYTSIKCARAKSDFPVNLLNHETVTSFTFNASRMPANALVDLLQALLPKWPHLKELRLTEAAIPSDTVCLPTKVSHRLKTLRLCLCDFKQAEFVKMLWGETNALEHLSLDGSDIQDLPLLEHPLKTLSIIGTMGSLDRFLPGVEDLSVGFGLRITDDSRTIVRPINVKGVSKALRHLEIVARPENDPFFASFGVSFCKLCEDGQFPQLESITCTGPYGSDHTQHIFLNMCKERQILFKSRPLFGKARLLDGKV